MMETLRVKPRNWLIIAFRKWHTWAGLGAALFILVAGFSGIVLNYKKPVFTALGLENEPPRNSGSSGGAPVFSTRTGLGAAAVTPAQAIEEALRQWGDVPLDRIELKNEHGQLVYKIKQAKGPELWVDALTGSSFVKNEYEKFKARPGAEPSRQFDWGKLLLDLHTGKIGGETGKALMSAAAVLLLFLTGSGVYLWFKPLLIRRQNARAKALPQSPAAGAGLRNEPAGHLASAQRSSKNPAAATFPA